MKEEIQKIIKENNICLFMKGTPDSIWSRIMAVSNILKHLNVDFKGVNVLENENLRQGIKTLATGQLFPSYM